MKQPNLFLFPFAGGSSYSYRMFKDIFPKEFSLTSIEYPGRGARMRENLLKETQSLVAQSDLTVSRGLHAPYFFFGHSMGTLISYLLIKKFQKEKKELPVHLFVSGRGGPSQPPENIRHNLPTDEFWTAVEELGGCPEEVLSSKELKEFFEPILRADFEALETYQYESSAPLNIPITIFLGKDDKVTHEEALLWQRETIYPIEIHYFEGGHFFIFDHVKEISQLITDKINSYKK